MIQTPAAYWKERAEKAEAERADLLEALKEIASRSGAGVYDCPDIAREAIANVKGQS